MFSLPSLHLRTRRKGLHSWPCILDFVLTFADPNDSTFQAYRCISALYCNLALTKCAVPPEMASLVEYFESGLRKIEPDFKGARMPEESVAMQLNVINGLTIEQTGAFLGLHGDRHWG